MAGELLAAASCYAAEHDLMWRIWGLVGEIGREEPKIMKLAEPSVRRRIVPIILQARNRDVEAADHIEQALAKWRDRFPSRKVRDNHSFCIWRQEIGGYCGPSEAKDRQIMTLIKIQT